MRVFKAVSTLSSWACIIVFMAPNDVKRYRKPEDLCNRELVWGLIEMGLEPLARFRNIPLFLFLGACLSLRSA